MSAEGRQMNHTIPAAPELESYCGSWIVVIRRTRCPICEIYDRSDADSIMQRRPDLEVLTAAQWLAEFNRRYTS